MADAIPSTRAYSGSAAMGPSLPGMDTADVLERLPELADAVRERGEASGPGDRKWRLVAFEPGEAGGGEVHLSTYAQCRALALDLAELGCIVKVCDGDGHVRLWMWPHQH